MAKKADEKLMVTEQIFEVRHVPLGSFLDIRGHVADYIRESKFLPNWTIGTNVVNFRDSPNAVKKEGAFASFRNAGYFVYDPETKNYFVDRAGLFWRTLQKNPHYKIQALERFGARAKVFLPSAKSFEAINDTIYRTFYSDKVREAVGGEEQDCLFTIELREEGFDGRITVGPIHKDEAGRYFSFESKEFEKAGFYIDVDFFRTKEIGSDDIVKLLRSAVDLTWIKVERLAAGAGV